MEDSNPYRSPTADLPSPPKPRFRWWLLLFCLLGGWVTLWIAAILAFFVALSFSNM